VLKTLASKQNPIARMMKVGDQPEKRPVKRPICQKKKKKKKKKEKSRIIQSRGEECRYCASQNIEPQPGNGLILSIQRHKTHSKSVDIGKSYHMLNYFDPS